MTAIAHQPHPVTRVLTGVRDQLASVAQAPVWSMDATETTAALDDVLRAEAQLAELKSRLLSHADRIDVAAETGAPRPPPGTPTRPAPDAPSPSPRCGSLKASTPTT